MADDEIFVSDGTKCDTGNILDIFGHKNKIAISDPVYPVYVDTNVMAGHTGEANEAGAYAKLVYLPCRPSNGFMPEPPKRHVDLIYLCSPNNPTGAAANRPQLEAWVKYALEHKAVILFDAAYEAYITDPALPHSIYEIPGARDCAIEFRSCSKNGGFTGVRCAFTVVPKSVRAAHQNRRDATAPCLVAAAHDDQIQRRKLHRPARLPRRFIRRMARRRYARSSNIISATRRSCAKARKRAGLKVFGGVERAVHLGESAEGRHELAGVRQNLERSQRGHHARQRFRFERRRLFPHQRLQQPRQRRGSRPPIAGVEVVSRMVPIVAPYIFNLAILLLICARWIAELWLSRLNRRHVLAHANEIPPAFHGIIDEPTYKKSVEYTLAKGKFAEMEDGYNTAVLIIFLFSGVLPWAFHLFSAGLGQSAWVMAVLSICRRLRPVAAELAV